MTYKLNEEYIAGFLDADGSIFIRKGKQKYKDKFYETYSLEVNITNGICLR